MVKILQFKHQNFSLTSTALTIAKLDFWFNDINSSNTTMPLGLLILRPGSSMPAIKLHKLDQILHGTDIYIYELVDETDYTRRKFFSSIQLFCQRICCPIINSNSISGLEPYDFPITRDHYLLEIV